MFDKLVIALISPLGTALALGAVALVLGLWRRGGRWAWVLGLVALAWLWVWSLPVVSHALRTSIEDRHPVAELAALPQAAAIVVLGGGVRPPEAAGQPADLLNAADRVWLGAQLFHAGKAPLVVLSGGADPRISAASEAQAMREFAQDLGVPPGALLLEERSLNTRQNAQFTAELLRPRRVENILLVTSALHLPRATALFEAQGFSVTPVAADHEARHRFRARDWLPEAEALEGSARAFKEILGSASGR